MPSQILQVSRRGTSLNCKIRQPCRPARTEPILGHFNGSGITVECRHLVAMDGIEERPANRVRSWPRTAPSGAALWGNSLDARTESATRKRDHRRGRRISVRRTTRAASGKIGSSMIPMKGGMAPSTSRHLSKVMPSRTQKWGESTCVELLANVE